MTYEPRWLPYWAKAHTSEDGLTKTHALACHLLDVAAVADLLLDRFPERLLRLAAMLDAEPTALRAVIVRLAALHDLGKFHPDFQRKLEGYCEMHLRGLVKYINPKEKPLRHDILGYEIAERIGLFSFFTPQFPEFLKHEFDTLFGPAMLHHGRPAEIRGNQSQWKNSLNAIEPSIEDFIRDAFAILPSGGVAMKGEPREEKLAAFSWALAAFMVISDWIGSNEEHFEYCEKPKSLSAYWEHAKRQAAGAVEKAGSRGGLSRGTGLQRRAYEPGRANTVSVPPRAV